MAFPDGDKKVTSFDLQNEDSAISDLQKKVIALNSHGLLKINWTPMLGNSNSLFEKVALFHIWTLDNIHKNHGGGILHYLPSPEQQGGLQRYLAQHNCISILWDGNKLSLVGSVTPASIEIVQDVALHQNSTPEAIASRLEYSLGYIRNELTNLSRHRVLVRRKRLSILSNISEIPFVHRNRWHYISPWEL